MTTLPHSDEGRIPLPSISASVMLLERLKALHPQSIDLSLGRIERLLAALDHPERRLPPVVHVAGTNGKGSLIAFVRAMAQALGKRAHVYTSPHLVNFHERVVLAGPAGAAPISEAMLVDCLARAEAANEGELITLFEITTAAAFLAFAETPADLLLLETGLGGRLDATNVVDKPLATSITPISIDHVSFLGNTLAAIAGEKAGILKPGVPCVVGRQEGEALEVNLAPHAQVCLYDRLGEGRSDSAPHTQTFASQADDLDGVISGLGLTRPVVVLGDSLGAPIALTWASRHEKDARASVLLAPPPPGFMGPHGALNRLLPPKNPRDYVLSNLWSDLDHMNNPALNRESLDPRSWDAYLRLPPTSTPLYDLATPTPPWLASIDAKKVNDAWQQGQSRVLRLSSSSELVTVAKDADWPEAIQRTLERALQS